MNKENKSQNKTQIKIIDMHAHIASLDLFHEYFIEGLIGGLKKSIIEVSDFPENSNLIDRLIKRKLNDQDCNQLIAEMDNAGIEKTVLLIADFGFGIDESKLPLADIYKSYHQILLQYPERFIVFGGIDPRRGREAIELFEKGITEYQFKGLKLYPPCGYELNDPRLYPYYELCKQHNIPVLTHTGPSLKSMSVDKEYPSSVYKIAEDFKEVNFILGHAAFQNFKVNLKLAEDNENVFLETSGFQKLLNEPEYIKNCFDILIRKIPYQVVFGTDWPMFNIIDSQKKWVDFFQNLNLMSDLEEQLFFRENALRAFKIDSNNSLNI